jgi:SPP1 family predicted phage head-tail adaptor
VRAGTLTDWITIQDRQDAQDAAGEPIAAWVDVATCKADVRYLRGLEAIRSDAPVSIVKASVRIRRGTVVTAAMRVMHGATILNVQAALPGGDHHEYVDLVCEAGANEG